MDYNIGFNFWHKVSINKNKIINRHQIKKNIENNDYERNDTNRTFNSYTPISYATLNSYGYKIISFRGWGQKTNASLYKIKVITYKLTNYENEMYSVSILSNCPSFIKIYLKRLQDNNAEIILIRKDIEGKEKTEARTIGKINI